MCEFKGRISVNRRSLHFVFLLCIFHICVTKFPCLEIHVICNDVNDCFLRQLVLWYLWSRFVKYNSILPIFGFLVPLSTLEIYIIFTWNSIFLKKNLPTEKHFSNKLDLTIQRLFVFSRSKVWNFAVWCHLMITRTQVNMWIWAFSEKAWGSISISAKH